MKRPIREFAQAVSARINYRAEVHSAEWYGEDLMLGGYKNLMPNSIYNIPVFLIDNISAEDHEKNIIAAYRKSRRHGVENYLKKYLKKDALNHLMTLL